MKQEGKLPFEWEQISLGWFNLNLIIFSFDADFLKVSVGFIHPSHWPRINMVLDLLLLISLTACLVVKIWWAEDKNTEPDYQDTWRKPYQGYTVRSPQKKMMKNITSSHPTSYKKNKKKNKDWRFLYSVEGGRIKDCVKTQEDEKRGSKRMRETIWTSASSGHRLLTSMVFTQISWS